MKSSRKSDGSGVKVVAQNRKARWDYEIIEAFEAGVVLLGTEVKSLRAGKANIGESYARIDGGEVFLYNAHISHYEGGNRNNHDPERPRKLLLHRSEIDRLSSTEQRGLTLVPTRLYFKGGKAKVEIAIARGKRQFDKRRDIALKDAARSIDRALREARS
ncbi:MAG TPA: SsrA-binding protein SmpB [Candidatus Latescibacteria bacterium]|nr:SsrA-binding protein SmpB [Candidatus Latescibacterota bacterium]